MQYIRINPASDQERAASVHHHRFGLWRRDLRFQFGHFIRDCGCGAKQYGAGNEFGINVTVIETVEKTHNRRM